jgi:hypothetical protein
VQPEYKGFENPLQMSLTAAKTVHNQHSNNGAQSVDGFVPKNNEKNGERWGLWEKMGFRILGKKWKNGENGGKWMVGGGSTAAR